MTSIIGRLARTASQRRFAFGLTVRARRKALGLTQEALADRAGCDRQSINRVENGRFSPSLDRLWDLADALGVPLSELVTDAEQRLTPKDGAA